MSLRKIETGFGFWFCFYGEKKKRGFWTINLYSFRNCKMTAALILLLKLCPFFFKILRTFSTIWRRPCEFFFLFIWWDFVWSVFWGLELKFLFSYGTVINESWTLSRLIPMFINLRAVVPGDLLVFFSLSLNFFNVL